MHGTLSQRMLLRQSNYHDLQDNHSPCIQNFFQILIALI